VYKGDRGEKSVEIWKGGWRKKDNGLWVGWVRG
jgi:hypothetical protein